MTILFWFLHFRNIDLGIKSFLNYPASLSNKFQAVAKHVSMIVVQILSFYKYAQKLQFYIFYFELHEKNTVYKSFDLARVKSFSK